MEELKLKSVNDLKVILRRAGVDYSDCFEKSDLIEKILSTNAHLVPEGPSTKHNVQIGELSCSVIQNSSQPDVIVILSHGFGANAKDLVPIAESVVMPLVKGKIKFVFPNAPEANPAGGLMWWPIDLQKLMMLFISGQIDKIIEESPPAFMESSKKLIGMIETLSKEHGLPLSKFIVGGFSQGAMLSIDVCLKLKENVGALVPWSAGYINAKQWRELSPQKKGLKVYQSHGTQDQLIPFQMAMMLKTEIFEKSELDLNFLSFEGQHTIPNEVVQTFVRIVQTVLAN